jgi:hypothetical protein
MILMLTQAIIKSLGHGAMDVEYMNKLVYLSTQQNFSGD